MYPWRYILTAYLPRRNRKLIILLFPVCFFFLLLKSVEDFVNILPEVPPQSSFERELRDLMNVANGNKEYFKGLHGFWHNYIPSQSAQRMATMKVSEMEPFLRQESKIYSSLMGYNGGEGSGCYLGNGTVVNTGCCPLVPVKWKTCNILFMAERFQGNGSIRKGGFLINDQYVSCDVTDDVIHLLLLDKACTVQYSTRFHNIHQASAALTLMPTDAVIVGVSVGVFGQLIPKHLNITLRFKVKNTVIAFAASKSSPGSARFEAMSRVGGEKKMFLPVHSGHKLKMELQPLNSTNITESHIFQDVRPGGHWSPMECKTRWRIAIVIPFRNREKHLEIFLQNIVPFLQKQMISFTIFVVEQEGEAVFNRASLMNVGFQMGQSLGKFDCYVFHDVDLIPEDLSHLYACSEWPRHLVVGRSSSKYSLEYPEYFGGATMLRPEHILKINGFSNKFWGWGGEDDNIFMRCVMAGLNVTRFPQDIARYTMLEHNTESGNPHMNRSFAYRWSHKKNMTSQVQPEINMAAILNYSRDAAHVMRDIWAAEFQPPNDGLHTVNFTLNSIHKKPYYTLIKVNLPGPNVTDLICKDRSLVDRGSRKMRERLDEMCGFVKTAEKTKELKFSWRDIVEPSWKFNWPLTL